MLDAYVIKKNKYKYVSSFFLLTLLFLSNNLIANEVKVLGIVIVEQGNQDRPITAFIDASSGMVFMDASNETEETFLFDLKQSKVYSIDHNKELITEMDMLPKYVPDERMKALSFDKAADTMAVDSYDANKFTLKVDETECVSVYLSKSLSELPEVKSFFSLYGRIIKLGNVGNVFKSLKDKSASRYCVYAKEYIYKYIQKNGIPLKIEKEGKDWLEVVSIKDNMIADKRMFLLPEVYKKTSMLEEIMKSSEKN